MAGGGATSQGTAQATGSANTQSGPFQSNTTPRSGFGGLAQNLALGVGNRMFNTFYPMPQQTAPAPTPPTYQMPAPQGMPGDIPPLVNQAYTNILNRPADAAGAAYYQDQLANQGMTGQGLVSSIVGSPEFQRQQQYEQAYTQQNRPGPYGAPYNPNTTPAPTTGPQGEALTRVDGKQGYYRQATADEIRRASQASNFNVYPFNIAGNVDPVEGYNARTRQVFVPYTPPASTQSQQFYQPIYQTRYQDYAPVGFQGPFGGQMNPYGGFNPYAGFGGMGGRYGGGFGGFNQSPFMGGGRNYYAFSEGGDVPKGGIADLMS